MPVGALIGLLCMRIAHKIYVLLGDRVRGVGFLWFYFQFQGPFVAKNYPGYVDHFQNLPENLERRVVIARRQINYGIIATILWIVFVFSFGAVAAYLRRHGYA
jgi:hypothetical protein